MIFIMMMMMIFDNDDDDDLKRLDVDDRMLRYCC
jgi:hypothetical protein